MSDAQPVPAEVLRVTARQDLGGATVVLEGEFDMTGVEAFWAHVSEALEGRPRSVTVNARGLTFVDSSGLMALARARDVATDPGMTFRISEPSPPVRRIAEMCGLEDLLSVD
jgi:anti-anti-sigma factor